MPDPFLYESLNAVSSMGFLNKEIPDSVSQNLNPRYELREYQAEAFARFIHCFNNDFPGKTLPLHLLFNMATGSGKTLIMAGLILYLYQQGYRNFLFFVNSSNIIEKTKDNFLNPASIKFLFKPEIVIDNRRVNISQVDNFEAVNPDDINICFTTIQKLHSDLSTEKENALTFEDFRKHRIVLIADEAHHMNVSTRSELEMFESWENTVQRIFAQNRQNLLLEFTATHDYTDPNMVAKYRDKVIFRYDLPQFRNDGFSKDVALIYSDFDLDERILQALVLSQYKQEVAARHRINLKPVILFKAQRTIAQSQENQENFYRLIEGLDGDQVTAIRRSNIDIIKRAFLFFDKRGISDDQLAGRLKREFHSDFCLSVNDEKEKENYQILVNTLEDRSNRIRGIFAVQKLNEGWDVLNLFDIVRCYEPRDTGRARIGSTTVSEAQLIGRGARYFPFVVPENDDRFRRKFDGDLDNELRVIEELHYHSINDSRYIAEIRQALVEQGIMDDRTVERRLTLKAPFKQTDFYKFGLIFVNERQPKDYTSVRSFADLGVSRRNYTHTIATGHGDAALVLSGERQRAVITDENRCDILLNEIEKNIIQSALARHPFFTFASLLRYFPNLKSIQELITSPDYLAGLSITFQGDIYNIQENRPEKLKAVIGLLNQIEAEIRQQITEYQGSKEFRKEWIHQVFDDRTLKFDENNARGNEDAQFTGFVSSKDWFAYNTIYGTSEEKDFVRMLDLQLSALRERFDRVYLVRNEGHFAIYDFEQGRPFQPDFVLFLREKTGEILTYQVFIEPKGEHLAEHDRWKEDFLKQITAEYGNQVIKLDPKSPYRLVGVPFYNLANQNDFKSSLEAVL